MKTTDEVLESFTGTKPDNTAIYLVKGSDLKTLYLSENIPGLLCMSREEYTGITKKDAFDMTIPQDRPALQAAVGKCLKTGLPFDHYYRVYHREKGFEWVHVYAHVFGATEEGQLIIAQFANMTAEGSIYQRILDASDWQAMVIDRRSYEILYANEKARMRNDAAPDSLLDQTCYGYFRGNESPCENCIMDIKTENGSWEQFRIDEAHGKWEQVTGKEISWCGHDAVLLLIKDITTEKEKELEIARSHQMYVDASQEAQLIVWTYDMQKHQVVLMQSGYTKEICEKLGVPPVIENAPESLVPFVDDGGRDAFLKCYRDIEQGKMTVLCEFRFQLPGQKTPQYERMTLKRINDKNGRLLTVYGCGINITSQKQIEEKFNITYRQLDNPNSYGSFHLNLTKNWCGNGRKGKSGIRNVMDVQKSGTVDGYFRDFAALIADENVRKEFFGRFDRELLIQKFSEGTEKAVIDYPVIYENGIRHWREGILSMAKNPTSGDIEAITYSLDIDARKRDELIMDKLINENFDYIGIIHPYAKTFEFRSRKPWVRNGEIGETLDYGECCRYVASQIQNDDEREYFREAVTVERILKNLWANGHCAASYTNTVDGKVTCIGLQYCWLDNPGGDILVLRSDSTEAYEREQKQMTQIRESMLEANRANEAKSAFLSSMSHDLRTPLNGVIGFTDIALREKDPEKKQEYLKKIRDSGNLLLNLVNDTLELSRIESGKAVIEPEALKARECTMAIIDALKPTADEKGVKLILENELRDEVIWADKLKLQKIQLNVISNAIKYTPGGGTVTVSDRVLDPPENGCNRRFIVEDTGIGMSREFMKIMFEPFSQEHRKEAGNITGTGLGLSIVRRYVELAGGCIKIDSEVGKGTRVTIDMPVKVIEKTEGMSGNGDTAENTDEDRLRGKRILLCEDNHINAEIATLFLKDRNMTVDWVSDGKACVGKFGSSAPGYYDMILMDIRMPVMDGYEATEAIRRMNRKDAAVIPIIAMTADAFADDIQRCMDVGMNAHISKPIAPGKLYQTMLEKIGSRKM